MNTSCPASCMFSPGAPPSPEHTFLLMCTRLTSCYVLHMWKATSRKCQPPIDMTGHYLEYGSGASFTLDIPPPPQHASVQLCWPGIPLYCLVSAAATARWLLWQRLRCCWWSQELRMELRRQNTVWLIGYLLREHFKDLPFILHRTDKTQTQHIVNAWICLVRYRPVHHTN